MSAGQGRFSTVYSGQYKGADVAVKVLKKDFTGDDYETFVQVGSTFCIRPFPFKLVFISAIISLVNNGIRLTCMIPATLQDIVCE